MHAVPVTPQQPLSSSQGPQKGDPQIRQRQAQTTQPRAGMGPAGAGGGPNGPLGHPGWVAQTGTARTSAIVLEATTTKLLVPSRAALNALLAVPLVLWSVAVLWGITHSEPVPGGSKRDFEHPLMWFDRHVFRVWGPLLPLAPLLLRCIALGLPTPAPSTSTTAPGRKAGGEGGKHGGGPLPVLRPAPSLPLQALAAYLVVIVARMLLYLGHVALQRSSAVALVSDHLLLAASVVACFQAELVLCLSDVFKLELLRGHTHPGAGLELRQGAVVGAMVSSMFLLVFVYGDMYCTARWYHHTAESAGALLAGAALFNLPVASWVLSHAGKVARE